MTSKKLSILNDFHSQISSNKLPLNSDVIKAISYGKESAKISKEDAVKKVADQVLELWNRASIPIISKIRLRAKLHAYFEEYSKLCYSKQNLAKLSLFKVNTHC